MDLEARIARRIEEEELLAADARRELESLGPDAYRRVIDRLWTAVYRHEGLAAALREVLEDGF